MARPAGTDGWLDLSPRARTGVGWAATVLLLVAVAAFVGFLGGDGDGVALGPGGSGTASGSSVAPIAFGTAIDTNSGEVAIPTGSDRFVASDSFAYSARSGAAEPGGMVQVEVIRVAGGTEETVQQRAAQRLAGPRGVIAFQVPADVLFRDFGPGDYLMRIYLAGKSAPVAEGRFSLVAPVPSSS